MPSETRRGTRREGRRGDAGTARVVPRARVCGPRGRVASRRGSRRRERGVRSRRRRLGFGRASATNARPVAPGGRDGRRRHRRAGRRVGRARASSSFPGVVAARRRSRRRVASRVRAPPRRHLLAIGARLGSRGTRRDAGRTSRSRPRRRRDDAARGKGYRARRGYVPSTMCVGEARVKEGRRARPTQPLCRRGEKADPGPARRSRRNSARYAPTIQPGAPPPREKKMNHRTIDRDAPDVHL